MRSQWQQDAASVHSYLPQDRAAGYADGFTPYDNQDGGRQLETPQDGGPSKDRDLPPNREALMGRTPSAPKVRLTSCDNR